MGWYYDSIVARHSFVAVIPEPSAFALVTLGMLVSIVYHRRCKR